MNSKNPVLSLCIPCYKRLDQVRNTLHSIYDVNKDVPLEEYEVVISDNDPEREIESVVREFSQYPNIIYRATKCEGFMNSFFALSYGQGSFLKLHNSQNVFYPGTLARVISFIKNYLETKPMCFFSNGWLNWKGVRTYNSFEDFMAALSYWSSSSAGFGIWKDDFDFIGKIDLDPLFPHTSLFMTQFGKEKYCIDNTPFFYAQRIPKRGDHNKFKAFTINYPQLVSYTCEEGHISVKCRDRIFRGIYTKFLPTLLFNKYIARIETYDITDYKKNCGRFFPKGAYYLTWVIMFFIPIDIVLRRIRQKLYGA